MEELLPTERKELEAFLGQALESWGVQLSPGYDVSLRFMAHAWEPLRVYHKPLVSGAVQHGQRGVVWRRAAWCGVAQCNAKQRSMES